VRVEVDRDALGERADAVELVQRGGQQRGVVPVRRGQDPAERDAAPVDQQGPLHAEFSPVNGTAAGALAAAGCLGDAPVNGQFLQDQADDPVIGIPGDGLQLREDPQPDPLVAPFPDRGGAAGAVGDRLI